MPKPTFDLCYTSARPAALVPVINLWLGRAADPSRCRFWVAVDRDDAASREALEEVPNKTLRQIHPLINEGPRTCVSGWNTAAAPGDGDIIIAVADDFDPPKGWDAALELRDYQPPQGEWWAREAVIAVADGYNTDLFTLAILSRVRYRRFGYLFHPSYLSLFSDTEFTHVAIMERVAIDARFLCFEHMHPDCGKRQRDALDLQHASKARWANGELLFNARQPLGFPIDAGPNGAWEALDCALFVQAIKDDLCLYEVCARILEEGALSLDQRCQTVFICCPDEYWSGEKTPGEHTAEVLEVVARLGKDFPQARIFGWQLDVASHRQPGSTRLEVETRFRNGCLERIRHLGFKHILVADGDELWQPGFLAKLGDFVRARRPLSVYTGMVPVIGLPGYPVVEALDKATVYVGQGGWFELCRGVGGLRHELVSYDVMHFTATRRTREEIARKHRESGHADDPQYRMDEWIEKVLPHIRPGFAHRWSETNTGLHMYQPYQIWKSCREWTPAEWAVLPAGVKPYLAKPHAA